MIDELKPYAEYQPTKSRWLGHIPAHWKTRSLWTIAKLRLELNPGSLKLLSVFLDRGVIPYSEGGGQVHAPSLDLSNYQVVRRGDFVLNNQQAWRGSVGVSAHDGIISPAYVVLQLSDELHPFFANCLMRCPRMVDQFVAASKGVGDIQRQLYWPLLRTVQVPIPDSEEQVTIVRFLDEANGRLERAIRAKRKVIALLNEQKQAIIHRVVTRGLDPTVPIKSSGIHNLGDIPAHWEIPMNGRIFRENIRAHNDLPEPSLSLSQRDGLIRTEHMQERSLKTSSFANWKVTVPGDLVVNRFKAHLGVFFASTLRGIVSFHYGVFEPQRQLNTKYFELLYHTAPYRTIYAGRSNGMTVGLQNLSNQNFYAVRAIVPPVVEQDRIVAVCEIKTREQNAAIARLEREIGLLREYRTRLVADVVTGRLDVRPAAARLSVTTNTESVIADHESDDEDQSVDP